MSDLNDDDHEVGSPDDDADNADFAELGLRLLDPANEVHRLEAQGLVAEYVRKHGRAT